MRFRLVAATLLILAVALALAERGPGYTTDAAADAFLHANEPRYRMALGAAAEWANTLRVDPEALQAEGVKGKKKLVEAVELWRSLAAVADTDAHRAEILRHVEDLAAVTRTDAYHDMLTVDDDVFKQNATSYLRAAYLFDRLGIDTTRYRSEIEKVKPRLDAHMAERGPHQRASFGIYYEHFGLTPPLPLDAAMADGLVARHADVRRFTPDDVYELTHEVFVAFDFGDVRDITPYGDADLRWLRAALSALADEEIARRDPDRLAEVVSCLRLVRAMDLGAYTRGLEALLDQQASDGHWGDYPKERARIGDLVVYEAELHTTMVTVQALTLAFHPAWNDGLRPIVPP